MEHIENSTMQQQRKIIKVDEIEFPFSIPTEKLIRNFATLLVDGNERGHGGFGQIFHVYTVKGDSLALKKMLLPERSNFVTDETYERELSSRTRAFREEYETLCKLSSFRGFVKVHAYGLVEGTPAIVMEWVEGVSLSNAISELSVDASGTRMGALTVARIGRDIFHLLSRLEYQTELFVHRDISPANIMVRTHEKSLEQQAKEGAFDLCFIDFGSAATMRQTDGSFTVYTNILRGATADYAPPEMLTNDLPNLAELRMSTKIDVYAACSVLYFLLCGKKPFDLSGENGYYSEFLLKMEKKPQDCGFAQGTIERELANIIMQGIQPLQSDRPSSYALYRMLDYYVDQYQTNRERLSRGLKPLELDKSAFDVDAQSDIKIDMSNPLSRVRANGQQQGASNKRSPVPTGQPQGNTRAVAQTTSSRATYAQRGGVAQQNNGASTPSNVVYCLSCGKPNSAQARICSSCGKPLVRLATQGVGNAYPAIGQTAPMGSYAAPNNNVQSVRSSKRSQARGAVKPQTKASNRGRKAVVALALAGLLGVGAYAGFALSQGILSSGNASSDPSGSSVAAAQGSNVSSGTKASTVALEDIAKHPVGRWTATFKETSQSYACFGASEHPLEITITDVSDTGKITCDVTVMYHGHSRRQQTSDIDGSAADVVQSYRGLTATLSSGRFTLNLDESDVAGKDSRLEIACAIDSEGAMEAQVTSYCNGNATTDVFALEVS